MCSLLSLYIRQNNIIWILFLMIYRILSEYKKQMFSNKPFISHVFTVIKVTFNYKWQILLDLRLQFIIIGLFILYLRMYN